MFSFEVINQKDFKVCFSAFDNDFREEMKGLQKELERKEAELTSKIASVICHRSANKWQGYHRGPENSFTSK